MDRIIISFRQGISICNCTRAIEQAYVYGRQQIPLEQLVKESPYVQALTPEQRQKAYDLGLAAGKKKADQRQTNIDTTYNQAKDLLKQTGREKSGAYSAELAESVDVESLDEGQRAAYELAQQIAPAVQCNIICYQGSKGWGFYDHNTDTIHINVNAKWSGCSMMAFTLGHELVHRAAAGSPKQYRAFAKFLLEQYNKQGSDIHAMIREQMYWAEQSGNKLTRDQAFEEVVADACQRMLLDTDAGKKLAQWGARSQQNKSFLQKVKTIIEDLLKKLRGYFKNVDNDSLAAREFARIDKNAKQILADMFVDMSIVAGEKLSTIKAAGKLDQLNKNTATEGGRSYKIVAPFTDTSGVKYDSAVLLDTAFFDGLSPRNWGAKLRDFVRFRAKAEPVILPVEDENGTIQELVFADQKDRVRKTGGADHSVISELSSGTDNISKLAVIHIDEIVEVSEADVPYYTSQDPTENHGWLDKNGWLHRNAYVINSKNGNIYKLTFDIAKAADGRHILFATKGKIERVGSAKVGSLQSRGPKQNSNSSKTVPQTDLDVKRKNLEKAYAIDKENRSNKTQIGEDLSSRELLLNTVEGMVANDTEYKKLQEYRQKIKELDSTEEHLERLNEQLKQLYFGEGGRDYEMINKLEAQRSEALTKLNRYDSQLINLENTKPIRDIVNRMKQAAYQKGFQKAKDYYKQKSDAREEKLKQHYQESRRNAVERHDKAQIRQQIRKDVERLASLLNKGNKQKNVKQELQAFAGAALRTAQGTFLPTEKTKHPHRGDHSGVGVSYRLLANTKRSSHIHTITLSCSYKTSWWR